MSGLPQCSEAVRKLNPALFAPKPAATVVLDKPKGRVPNKTESDYRRTCIDTRRDVVSCHYEGVTLRLKCGRKYTPDWVIVRKDGVIELVECKGSYRLQSYGRSRLAWEVAQLDFPCFKFVWKTKSAGGWK